MSAAEDCGDSSAIISYFYRPYRVRRGLRMRCADPVEHYASYPNSANLGIAHPSSCPHVAQGRLRLSDPDPRPSSSLTLVVICLLLAEPPTPTTTFVSTASTNGTPEPRRRPYHGTTKGRPGGRVATELGFVHSGPLRRVRRRAARWPHRNRARPCPLRSKATKTTKDDQASLRLQSSTRSQNM